MFIKWSPSDDGKGAVDADPKSKDSEFIAKSEVAKIEADRDAARTERDAAKAEKRAAEAALAEKERLATEEKAAKDGDIEALRKSFTERETNLKTEKEAADKRLESAILKADVLSVLSDISVDPETAFLILKDDFEVKEVDGELRARPKKDAANVKDFILKKLETKQYLLKNDRKSGTDTKKVDAQGKVIEATTIPADINSYGPEKLREWMKANPKLAAELATKAMGG